MYATWNGNIQNANRLEIDDYECMLQREKEKRRRESESNESDSKRRANYSNE